MKKIKEFWRKLKYWQKGMYTGGFISLSLAIISYILITIVDYNGGDLQFATFGGALGVDNLYWFLLIHLIFPFWVIVFTFIPLLVMGALIGLIIGKIKKK